MSKNAGKHIQALAVAAVLLATPAGAFAQAQDATQSGTLNVPQVTKQDAADKGTYATGPPLAPESKEGFWGHMNPLARKKWVHRQIDPVKDRVNELDQLQAKNANDIRDVDGRATAGIKRAGDSAALADQHAGAAQARADQANGLAGSASSRTDALHGTVSNLDQYQTVSATAVPFLAGHTTLSRAAKADLDGVATKLNGEKGYILEVQGYSRAGVAPSQAMADAVVRYLVTEHQVPVYRIYKSGLGRVSSNTAASVGEKPLTNGVRVTLLHNSLATMDGQTAAAATPSGAKPANNIDSDSARMN